MEVVDEVVEVAAVAMEEVGAAVEVEEAEVVVAETTMTMMTRTTYLRPHLCPHLRPSRDPPDAVDDEPIGSSTMPRCNNN